MIKGILLKGPLFLALLACAGMLLHFSLQEQQEFLGKRSDSLASASRSAFILTRDAQNKFRDGDLQGAEQELVQALENNSLYVPAWLLLASILNDKEEKKRANAILDYTGELTSELLKWRWDRALVAYELGREELLPQELQFIINRIEGQSKDSALELAFRLFPKEVELEKNVGEGNLLHLLRHSINKKNIPFSLYFLQKMEQSGEELSDWDRRKLINMLIAEEELRRAGALWRKWFEDNKIVYNGHFTKPIMRSAFGWRFGKDKDFTLKFFPKAPRQEVERELQIQFKGWKNLEFNHFYQIVPLKEATTYLFSALMKSQRITTDQRPFFEITGFKCQMEPVRFEMVASNQNWTEVSGHFDVPSECSSVILRLRRNKSRKIDSKMSGKLWIKNIEIRDDCVGCGAVISEFKL